MDGVHGLASPELSVLDTEIDRGKVKSTWLVQAVEKGFPGDVCSYEWSLVRLYKSQIEDARVAGKQDEMAKDEKLLAQQKWIEEALKPKPSKIEGMEGDLDRTRKHIAQLEADRQWLLTVQARPK